MCSIIMWEAHSKPDVETYCKSKWSGDIVFSHGTGSGQGVAIFFPPTFTSQINAIYSKVDADGRTVCAQVELAGDSDPLFLMGVYGVSIGIQSKQCEFLDCAREILTVYFDT